MTLCYTPPIDPDHREEALRVSLEAALQQEEVVPDTGEVSWKGRLTHDASEAARGPNKSEMSLVKTGLKWSPIKRYHASMPKGRGSSTTWRLNIESLVRGGSSYPADGVPFALLLTIADIDGEGSVREEMRYSLQQLGVSLADITVAHRVRRRVG